MSNNNRDRGISTLKGSFFNTDGNSHEIITNDEAKNIFDFVISKEQSHRPNGTPIAGQYHLVRKDNPADEGIVVGSHGVGSQFDVEVQPSQVMDFFLENIMPEVPNLKIETVASIKGGALTFANFHYGNSYSLKNDDSPQYTNFLFVNPLTTGRLQILSHSVRVVCCNTLTQASKCGTGFNISHTQRAKFYVNMALDALKTQLAEANRLKEIIVKLDNIKCMSKNIDKILDMVYPVKKTAKADDVLTGQAKKAREDAKLRFESDQSFKEKTAWAFLNAMTFPLEHAKVTAKRTPIAIASDNLFGNRATKKSQMLSAVMEEFGLSA